MKIISWNVGGLRVCLQKGAMDEIFALKADIIMLQETHINEPLPEIEMLSKLGYFSTYSFAERKGYSLQDATIARTLT